MKQITPQEWRKLLTLFVANNDEIRPVFMKPFEQRGYVCATNGQILIRVAKGYIKEDFESTMKAPDVAAVIPTRNPQFAITLSALKGKFVRQHIDYDLTTVPCPHCDDECEVEWAFTDKDGDRHTMWAKCPCCHGSGREPNAIGKTCKVAGMTVNAHYMLLVYRVMSSLEIGAVDVTVGSRRQLLFHVADGVDVMTMSIATPS